MLRSRIAIVKLRVAFGKSLVDRFEMNEYLALRHAYERLGRRYMGSFGMKQDAGLQDSGILRTSSFVCARLLRDSRSLVRHLQASLVVPMELSLSAGSSVKYG